MAAPRPVFGEILGEHLRFRKTAFVAGRDGRNITGIRAIAHGAARVWQLWKDQRLLDKIVSGVDEPFPQAAEDIDRDNQGGEWQLAVFLYLRDEMEADYTFISASVGGRRAAEALSQQIINKRRRHPRALPIVKLAIGSFTSKKFGQVPAPLFEVVGWADQDGRPLADAPALFARDPSPTLTREVDLDDNIPI
jgi:hypothetical protein